MNTRRARSNLIRVAAVGPLVVFIRNSRLRCSTFTRDLSRCVQSMTSRIRVGGSKGSEVRNDRRWTVLERGAIEGQVFHRGGVEALATDVE